ncbi:MAG: gamma-glutamyl-gamma-aminobutyrate hydrolase family protein [Candidatus Protochlamydia sp.]|nr:gamma-glutamyl-gamma-aminobutyrate hydrolase family protein [Candidatus Protochlamydia sp.]
MKPIIGISASILMIEEGSFKGRERSFVGQDYVKAISQAGGIPVILPITEDEAITASQMDVIDGLLLTGGYDIHPFFYQEEPRPLLQTIRPERDSFEILLARLAHAQKKPILGICRGLQILNVAFGGTLYQDIQSLSKESLQHYQQAAGSVSTHTVGIVEGTLLKEIFGLTALLTNSFHHQAVKELAPTFKVCGRANDGIIEAIEKTDSPYVIGVQWHPELMFEKRDDIFTLFQSFVRACVVPQQAVK